jgi:GNAT superfamily N-acetyltransferase
VSIRHPVDPLIQAAGVYSWASQARQYPALGRPGISWLGGETPHGTVDCLLWRDPNRRLRGILNHYPFDVPGLEVAGNVNLWVHPQWQRQGIGSALVREAQRRWSVDLSRQRYTTAGAALADALDPDPAAPFRRRP